MTDHMRARSYLRSIGKMSDLRNELDKYVLSDEDRQIMEMLYIQKKPLDYVADMLGYSVSGIKKRHHLILCMISNYIDERE